MADSTVYASVATVQQFKVFMLRKKTRILESFFAVCSVEDVMGIQGLLYEGKEQAIRCLCRDCTNNY